MGLILASLGWNQAANRGLILQMKSDAILLINSLPLAAVSHFVYWIATTFPTQMVGLDIAPTMFCEFRELNRI